MTQREALEILKSGANVFLTGEPGSGKSHTINSYVSWLRGNGIEPAITASTGIAATHIGGYTIHSWSGIGIRKQLSDWDIDEISQNKRYAERMGEARVLIIDEVSMLSGTMLDMVDRVCRAVKQSEMPFGGLQVILVGDFFQLPPIEREAPPPSGGQLFGKEVNTRFAFESASWKALNPLVCYLHEQHRQEDATFLAFLSSLRRGDIQEEHYELLRGRYARTARPEMTHLYTHNADVDSQNAHKLEEIDEDVMLFEMETHGNKNAVAALVRGCLSPARLQLKVGARVMFTKNDVTSFKYANGTTGAVVRFSQDGNPMVQTKNGVIEAEKVDWKLEDGGRLVARISQVPLRLAWAITVHKSQGMSLDTAHMDLSRTFEYGQGYVALSRVRTLPGLTIAGLNERALQVHPDVLKKDGSFREASEKVCEIFNKIPDADRMAMQKNFVKACGGIWNDAAGTKLGEIKSARTRFPKKMPKPKKISTTEHTYSLIREGLPLADVAKLRELTLGTIATHVEVLAAEKRFSEQEIVAFLPENMVQEIPKVFALFEKRGIDSLMGLFFGLKKVYAYEDIKLARALYVLKTGVEAPKDR